MTHPNDWACEGSPSAASRRGEGGLHRPMAPVVRRAVCGQAHGRVHPAVSDEGGMTSHASNPTKLKVSGTYPRDSYPIPSYALESYYPTENIGPKTTQPKRGPDPGAGHQRNKHTVTQWLAARDRHKALGVGGTLSGLNEACVGVELLYDSMYLRAARSALSFALAMNSLPPLPPS